MINFYSKLTNFLAKKIVKNFKTDIHLSQVIASYLNVIEKNYYLKLKIIITKNLCKFVLVAGVLSTSFAFGKIKTKEFTNALPPTLTESAVLKIGERIDVEGGTARTFVLVNFNNNYIPLENYTLNGEGFTDDGNFNDVNAGDGIYTSTDVLNALPENKETAVGSFFVGDDFKYNEEFYASKVGIKIKCKISHVTTGTTPLGIPCNRVWGGCIKISDCEIELEFSW